MLGGETIFVFFRSKNFFLSYQDVFFSLIIFRYHIFYLSFF